jgi:hypothetical protein
MASPPPSDLLRRGLALEYTTLGWNVVGVAVLAWSAIKARSVALAGFGLDSLIEIGVSVVVVWELTTVVLATGHRAGHSMAGIIWTALTAVAMFLLAWGQARTGAALGNVVLGSEGRVTFVDGVLATAVLAGIALNATLNWWCRPRSGFRPCLLRCP